MRKHGKSFTDEIRRAILDAKRKGWSRYAISKATSLSQGNLGDFVAGRIGLSSTALDELARLLRWRLVTDTREAPKRRGKSS